MILLGKRIKELRNKYKLTQTELAQRVGVTKSTIAAYENDSRQPSYTVLIKMANVFKVSIDSLLLNQEENILNTNGLTEEQTLIIESLINHYRKTNLLEKFVSEFSLGLKERVDDYLNKNANNNRQSQES